MLTTNRPYVRFGGSLMTALALQVGLGPVPLSVAALPRAEQASCAAEAPANVVGRTTNEPVRLEANLGQIPGDVRFVARSGGAEVLLAPRAVVFNLTTFAPHVDRRGERPFERVEMPVPEAHAEVTMRLVGANLDPEVEGLDLLDGLSHYFIGNDPSAWVRNVPSYGRVRYGSVYEGVDMLFYGREGALEYDLVVAPGADPSVVNLSFEGADSVAIDETGALVLETPAGSVRQRAPVVYQDFQGRRESVTGRYVLQAGGHIGFDLGAYDRSAPLVIDPVIAYTTLISASLTQPWEDSSDITLDRFGYSYVVGAVADEQSFDVFINKYSTAGAFVYRAIVGGSDDEYGTSVAVDTNGNAYVTGHTESSDFPTILPAAQTSLGASSDAFALKLGATGSTLLVSTYLGGSNNDDGTGIAIDSANNIYVAGTTTSPDFPVRQGFQMSLHGVVGSFVTKIAASGATLVYSTYLGGYAGPALARGIAVDGAGCAYVVGLNRGSDFPVSHPIDATLGGIEDAFVTKLNATGSSLAYSTLLGGGSNDFAYDVALDAAADAYVVGYTQSSDFPTVAAYQGAMGGGPADAFVTAVNATGSGLIFSSFLGGGGLDYATGVGVSASGDICVAGQTGSPDFPLRNAFGGATTTVGICTFVTRFRTGWAVDYSTTFGSSPSFMTPSAFKVAADASGSATVLYTVLSFATGPPYEWQYYVARIVNNADLELTMSATPSAVRRGQNETYCLTVTNRGPESATNAMVRMPTPSQTTFVSVSGSQGSLLSSPSPGGAGVVYFGLGNLAPGEKAIVTIVVNVPSSTTITSVTGQAFVSDTSSDPNGSNNSATLTTRIL